MFTTWPSFYEFPTQIVETEERIGNGLSAGAVEVGAEYFTTLGIELPSGRDSTPGDAAGAEPVAVISETLAEQLWPGGHAVGQYVRTIEETPRRPASQPVAAGDRCRRGRAPDLL